MKWVKTEGAPIFTCATPLGKYEIIGDSETYSTYIGNERISRKKDLFTAKQDAKAHLTTAYYKLKFYLDL